MIVILQIVAGVCALAGLIALLTGARAKSNAGRMGALRIVQAGMTLAGLALIAASLLDKRWDGAAYGLILIVFGTGVTGFGKPGKTDGSGDRSSR